MVGIFIVLTLIGLSILVTRVVTRALVLTGLSEEAARFQARSVFTGTGYTTDESESIMQHPVRRRIIMGLMLLQSAGIVTVITMLILSFVDTPSMVDVMQRGGLLIGGLAALIILSKNKRVERLMSHVIEWAIERFSDLHIRDYYTLLHLEKDFVVQRVRVVENSWFAEKTLDELKLAEKDVLVLGVARNGEFIGAPGGDFEIEVGDDLTLYGRHTGFEELRERVAAERDEEAPGDDDESDFVPQEEEFRGAETESS